MISFPRLAFTAVLFSIVFCSLRAEVSPFALPAGAPLATLALPSGIEMGKVSIAVSKALMADGWENLGWEGNVTTATTKASRVNIKVFALASTAEVKLYAQYSSGSNVAPDKCRQISVRELRSLGKTIATKLNLSFRKAKMDGGVDQAVVDE
jgi:hypothetical protein